MKPKADDFRATTPHALAWLLALGIAVGCGSGDARAAEFTPTPKASAARDASQEFFKDPKVRIFQFEIPDTALAALRRAPRNYAKGTMREGPRVLTNVAFRLKGMGSFRNVDE